jgi:hypothetical protein
MREREREREREVWKSMPSERERWGMGGKLPEM